MKSKLIPLFTAAALSGGVHAQTQNYFGTSGTLNGSVWSTNPAGPYTSALNTTGGAVINFNNAATFNGASITVAGINATADAAIGTTGGTISNLSNGVIPISVATGATLNFGSQAFTNSTTAGYIKNGDGTLVMAGNTYGGGFTLNAGTLAVAGVNAMGGATGNTLTINGGTIRSSATAARDLSGKYSGGITIGGNFAVGDSTNNGALTFSDSMSLGAASRTIQVNSTATFGGVISGGSGVGLTKTGAGTLLLGPATFGGPDNTFDGGLFIHEGILAIRNATGAGGAGGITLGNSSGSANATLRVDNSFTPTNALTVASGSSGTKTLTAGNVGTPGYNGSITLNDALTVAVTSTGTTNTNFTLGGASGISLGSHQLTLSLAQGTTGNTNNATITLNKPVSGTGSILVQGGGLSTGTRTAAISGTNSYTGGTTVGGTGSSRPLVVNVSGDQSAATGGWNIDVNNESSGFSNTVNFASGSTVSVASGKSITLGGTAGHFSARTLNAAGALSNDGTLLVRRSSTVNVTGAWTQNGAATLATQGGGQAALNINTGGSFTYTSATNFALNTSTSANVVTDLTVSGGTLTTGTAFRNNTVTAEATNFAQLTLNDGGTLQLSTNVAQLLTTAGGNIRMRLGETGTGGILDTNGFNTTIDREITNITGQAGKLTKQGAGILTLSGSSTYTGATTVSAGTLLINGSISNSELTSVLNGATLGGSGSLGALSVLAGGTLAPGNSPGTLSTGTITLDEASLLSFELNPADPTPGLDINDLVEVSGNLTLGGILSVSPTNGDFLSVAAGTAWRLFNYSGTLTENSLTLGTMPTLGGSLTWNIDTSTSGQVNLVAIPEPATALLGGLGLVLLLRRRRS
jgi:autotransporter-associated beta strand protein